MKFAFRNASPIPSVMFVQSRAAVAASLNLQVDHAGVEIRRIGRIRRDEPAVAGQRLLPSRRLQRLVDERAVVLRAADDRAGVRVPGRAVELRDAEVVVERRVSRPGGVADVGGLVDTAVVAEEHRAVPRIVVARILDDDVVIDVDAVADPLPGRAAVEGLPQVNAADDNVVAVARVDPQAPRRTTPGRCRAAGRPTPRGSWRRRRCSGRACRHRGRRERRSCRAGCARTRARCGPRPSAAPPSAATSVLHPTSRQRRRSRPRSPGGRSDGLKSTSCGVRPLLIQVKVAPLVLRQRPVLVPARITAPLGEIARRVTAENCVAVCASCVHVVPPSALLKIPAPRSESALP